MYYKVNYRNVSCIISFFILDSLGLTLDLFMQRMFNTEINLRMYKLNGKHNDW